MSFVFLAAVTIIPAGASFQCTPVRVWDGDGPIWCAEGPRVRLSGIAARERDGSCRDNQPCPSVAPEESRDALVALIGQPKGFSSEGHALVSGPTMTCVSVGPAGGSRTAAWCRSPLGGDISCRMVQTGFALRWDRYWKGHSCQ